LTFASIDGINIKLENSIATGCKYVVDAAKISGRITDIKTKMIDLKTDKESNSIKCLYIFVLEFADSSDSEDIDRK
jgi:hypothetical protein